MNHPFKEILPEWVAYVVIVPTFTINDEAMGASIFYHNNSTSALELQTQYNHRRGSMIFNRDRFIEGITPVVDPEVMMASLPKQARYKVDGTDEDYIDMTYRQFPWERFVGAIQWTIGKYFDRFGRKDDILKEAIKIEDYAVRFRQKVELEVKKRKKIDELV